MIGEPHHDTMRSDGRAISLSVVIPAYNERERLPPYLESVREHCDREFGGCYEVVVVDDGSSDGLGEFLAEEFLEWRQLALRRHPRNQGKGAAVRTGVLAARGRVVLFADADGATPIAEERTLRDAIHSGADVAVGDRQRDSTRTTRSRRRAFVGQMFSWVVRFAFDVGVRDTQCGFKMFTAAAARSLFSLTQRHDYLFDVELLWWAKRLHLVVAQIPVTWREVPGSKMRLLRDATNMLRGLVQLRGRLARIPSTPDISCDGLGARIETYEEGGLHRRAMRKCVALRRTGTSQSRQTKISP